MNFIKNMITYDSNSSSLKITLNGKVYTIEGNSNDSCAERNYDINSSVIVGYGTPMY